jgi:hypothetical protein
LQYLPTSQCGISIPAFLIIEQVPERVLQLDHSIWMWESTLARWKISHHSQPNTEHISEA